MPQDDTMIPPNHPPTHPNPIPPPPGGELALWAKLPKYKLTQPPSNPQATDPPPPLGARVGPTLKQRSGPGLSTSQLTDSTQKNWAGGRQGEMGMLVQ